jgi:hypothetical protein
MLYELKSALETHTSMLSSDDMIQQRADTSDVNLTRPTYTKFSYSSQNDKIGSAFGFGWSINIPYIERMNKIGVNRLYNQDLAHTFFNSSLSGELLPISATIPIGGASMLTLGQPDISLLSDVVNTVSSFIGNVVNLDGEINTQSSHFVSDESFSSLNLASRAMQNEPRH